MSNKPVMTTDASAAGPNLQRQREDARRSLLRANTAVALVLVVVIALAVAAVSLGWRATRSRDDAEVQQRRAEQAESKARVDLWRAYVSEARATRLGNLLERRAAALDSIRRAAAIGSSPELRNEAVATLALPDFQLESSFPLDGSVNKFAFDPALRRCALGLMNGDIVVSDLANRRELARLRRSDGGIPDEQRAVGGLEFSPDGRRLSARYIGGAFCIWDLDSGRALLRHDIDKPRHLASDARFSSDGRHVVAPVFSPRDGMAVFEIESGRQVAYFAEFSSFRHASVRPGAPMFAANNGTNLVVVNWETNERVEFPFPAGVRRTAWSPDGRELVITGHHLDVHVWNFANRERRVLSGHKGDVWEIAWDPAGTRLATSSEDGTSRIWDMRINRWVGVTSEGYVFQWSDDERIGCARLNTALDVRRLAGSSVYQSFSGAPQEADARIMDVSADGNWAIITVEGRGLFVWNLNTPGAPQSVPVEGVRSFCFHPTESRLLLTTASGPQSLGYYVVTNQQRAMLGFHPPTRLPTLPGRRLDLVSASGNGQAIAWVELGGGNVWVERPGVRPVRMRGIGHSSVAYQSSSARGAGTISLSPDGRWLACGYAAGSTKIFDAIKGEETALLSRRNANVQFSPDGQFLLVGERDHCRLFRVSDWSQVWQVAVAPSVTSVAAAAYSPDGSMIAVAKSAHSAALVDTATGRELAELEAPAPAPIDSIRWTSDGRRLVSGTRENLLEVWQPSMLRTELATLGLGWDSADRPLGTLAPPGPPRSRGTPAWIAAGVLATVSLVAVVAVLSLRRHRKLIFDFTRTEALAARRERELQDEREVNQLKSSFVSMVSHEFRTPLGIIQSSAQILDRYLDRLPAARRREQLESITRNVGRMSGLIDEVLLLGKVEAGRMTFTPATIDLESFCRRLTDEMTSATNRRCPIHLRLDDNHFPPAQADENLLRHILGNLISNAAKYSEPGSDVEFTVTRHQESALFTVRDRGIGIPESERDQLFVAFQRATNAAEFQGTGLGLTIVKRCTELHGGDVSFTSAEGQGTTFTVRIPMFDGNAPAPPASEELEKKL